jgi:predicted metal-dependent peptidase
LNAQLRDKRIEKAQLNVLFTVPFFAPGVAKMPVEWDETIDTACTDGKKIRFNPQFCDECKDQELVTVLCEEVGHALLGHLWRAPAGCDWGTWNQACDQAVRNMMAEFGAQRTEKGYADPFPFPRPELTRPDPQYKDLAEEVIYGRLASQKPPGGKGEKGASSGKGQAVKSPPGSIGEFQQPDKGAVEDKKARADWEHTLMQSVAMSKGRGVLPGSIARFVGEMLNPTVPWWELVRQWLREQASDDWDWMKPNPFYDESGFILPSLNSEKMGPIVFCVDTSGSIDAEMLRHFKSEMQNCLDDMRPSRLVEICCDTRITSEKEYQLGDQVAGDAPGGGGTSFVPALARCSEMSPEPKCVVYLTDADGVFPKEPDYPVLWVVYGVGKVPWGERVQAS